MQELNDIHKILGDSGMKKISKEIFERAFAKQHKLISIKNRASNMLLLASTMLFLSSSVLSFCAVIYGILPDDPVIDEFGNKYWRNEAGLFHREGGPAIEYSNGHKEWALNGELHREDGPAIEYANGDKYWYLNGELHREDGPAIEFASGGKEWWLNGVRQK